MYLKKEAVLAPNNKENRSFFSYFFYGFLAYCIFSSSVIHAEMTYSEIDKTPQKESSKIVDKQSIDKELTHKEDSFFSNDKHYSDEKADHSELPSFESLMIKTILMLGFMCSSLVAGAWFLKKLHGPSIRNKGSPASLIELIDKKSLSAKSVIWYARIDGINHIIIESQYGVAISRLLPEKQSSLYEGIEKTALNDTL